MRLERLALSHFRNYTEQTVDFAPGVNVFLGANAQGKTNLLEAIYMLALARSHRTAKDKDVIEHGQEVARLDGTVASDQRETALRLAIGPGGKKAAVNRIWQTRLSDYVGRLHVVLFAPEDLALVKGAPTERRRFLDTEISQLDRAYLQQSVQYQRLLKQRNVYLKTLQAKGSEADIYLGVLTEQLVDVATIIIQTRAQFVEQLSAFARPLHAALTDDAEELSLQYDATVDDPTADSETVRDALLSQFERIQARELKAGTTLIGPQREDLSFFVNGQAVSTYGSQGQQRTTVLSLKLAEIEWMEQTAGETPLLLLDDVLSELDDKRQTRLLSAIAGRIQTFLTTTDLSGIKSERPLHPTLFHIERGRITAREDQ